MDNDNWVTPPPPVDIAAQFPDLAHLSRTTTRLHPRLGSPSVFESSMGAKPFWPADESWPTCPGSHFGTYDEEPVAAVPLLQLFRRDVQQLPFPDGTDLLQLLWCPRDHADDKWPAGPKTTLYWRDSTTITDVIPEIPATPAHHGRYMLEPCVLHPEPGVIEYPSAGEFLPESWGWERLEELSEQLGYRADTALFEAPGTKVGGWPSFCQGPYWPDCATCGQRAEHLLTVSDFESPGDGGDRWAPQSSDDGAAPNHKDLDGGCMQLFYCPRCPGLPHIQYYDR